MLKYVEESNKVPVKGKYDVIVAGGGVAGVAAALAACRAGKKVMLIEKSLMLGGLATLGLINLFVPMCNGRGTQIIKGMAEELLRLSIKYGYDTIPEEWKNGEPGQGAKTRYITRFSANIFAMAMIEQIVDEGVDLLLDSVVSKPVMKDGHCEGLIVENKSGREFYEAGVVIDTTGDGDVIFRAGIPTVQGKNFFTYSAFSIDVESCKKAVETGRIDSALKKRGGGNANLYGKDHPEGMKLFEGTTAQEVTEYVVKNQKIVMERLKKDDRMSRDIITLPGMPQFRTTRHIEGDYTLTVEDKYRHFDDSISAICDFENRDFLYEIPYRCLCRKGFDNIITAGRSASAEGYAWDVIRVIPTAIVTGQAAGQAAALALDTQKPIWDVDIKTLQASLVKADVMIHFDDSLISKNVNNAQGEKFDIGHI